MTDAGSSRDVDSLSNPEGNLDGGADVVDGGAKPITGARTETPVGIRHIYSQVQAWSHDGLYFLAIDIDSREAVVFDAETWEEQVRLSRIGHRWINGTHSVLMFEDQANGAAELYAFDLDSRMESKLMDLGHPGLRAGRSQEETDRAGRWVAVYIDEASSGGPHIVTADLSKREIGTDIAIRDLGCEYEPDWVGVDPSGQFLLVQSVSDGPGTCRGLWAHDIQTGAPLRQLTEHHNHGSTGLGPNGRPYFLSTELAHPNDNGSPGIYRYWIDSGDREVVGSPLPWGALEHVSCLDGPGQPCMASASGASSGGYSGQVWRLDFDGQRTIVEPHYAPGCDYWGQAQVTVGPKGRYAFTTHAGDCARIRSIVVQ